MLTVNSEYLKNLHPDENFNASACINCGTCAAVCPLGIGLLPRRLFRYVLLGAEDKVIENIPAIYSCMLCRMCEDNCPAGVRIAGNIRSLREYINKEIYHL